MIRTSRSLLLLASTLLVGLLLGGGFAVRVGATENSYRQAVRFAEILSLVLENYVDPVEAERLLLGAYEGMLGGMDPNGAFLSPEEVAAWKNGRDRAASDPGLVVLKLGRSIQVVSVEPGSSADEAGVVAGDHLRSVDGSQVRDLSLAQVRRLIRGEPGSAVTLEVLHPHDGFKREEVELRRGSRGAGPYEIQVTRGTAVLTVRDLDRLAEDELEALYGELDDVGSRGIDRLLIDLRNVAEGDPRGVNRIASLFAGGTGTLLRLRDRSGRLIEAVESASESPRWSGSLAVLVNGATAGAAEALALLSRTSGGGTIFGEETYGLGSEAKLYELENGCGLLVSASIWETGDGDSWNADGVEPDRVVSVTGDDYGEIRARQLDRVLELLENPSEEEAEQLPDAA